MTTRWDHVVDRGATRGAQRCELACPDPLAASNTQVVVNAWLYGALGSCAVERPIVLSLPGAFSVGDLLAALGQRCGERFLARVIDRHGRKSSYCRVFVDGLPIDDLDGAAQAGPGPAQVEVILVMGIEGG